MYWYASVIRNNLCHGFDYRESLFTMPKIRLCFLYFLTIRSKKDQINIGQGFNQRFSSVTIVICFLYFLIIRYLKTCLIRKKTKCRKKSVPKPWARKREKIRILSVRYLIADWSGYFIILFYSFLISGKCHFYRLAKKS